MIRQVDKSRFNIPTSGHPKLHGDFAANPSEFTEGIFARVGWWLRHCLAEQTHLVLLSHARCSWRACCRSSPTLGSIRFI